MSCTKKYNRSICALALAVAIIVATVFTAANAQAAVELDIVTFGDSTTAPRDMGDYWLRTYSDILRDELPYRGITGTVTNKGVRGNMTTNAMDRFQSDVLNLEPDLVVMQFGINDAWTFLNTQPPRVTLSEYEANLRYMVGTLRGLETKVVLMTPNSLYPIDKNPVMDDYCDVVRQIAGDYATDAGFTFIDMQQLFIDYHAQPNQQMLDLMLPDGVHPSNRGHRFISEHLAEAIGAGPVNYSPQRSPANLAVWLKADEADVGTGGSVASWSDLAPSVAGANNAIQTITAKQPKLIENASPAGDKPVLRFDGDDYLDIAADAAFQSEAVSFFVVYKAPNASASTQRIIEAEDASPGNGFWGVSAYPTDGPTRQHATYARDASGNYKVKLSDAAACDEFVIVSGVINTSDLTVGDNSPTSLSGNFDRAEMLGGPLFDVDANAQGNQGIRIGARASAESNFLNGDIAEILIYDTALTVAERGMVEQYLWQKWFQPEPIPGDANCDGCVDSDDAMILAANWQKTADALWYEGDFNGDGAINDSDAGILAANWQSNPNDGISEAVPEPAIAVLAAGGLIICLGRRRKWLLALVLLTVCGFATTTATADDAPIPLTSGPGNDSEAAWSPDGNSIVFQSDRDGTLDLFLLDVKSGQEKPLVPGPGHACFPAWSPDGKWIAYSYAHFTKTAFEGIENGYNLFVVSATGGTPRRLTEGLHRDYCPTFSADGKTIYYSSNQGVKYRQNQVNLCAIPFEGGEPKVIMANEGRGVAAVQPTLSPDSRVVAFGLVAGFRGTWGIRLARLDRPDYGIALTSPHDVFYGPRWCPKGTLLACTGYQDGDDGWGVYLIDAKTGCKQRVPTGPGNSRSPAWSPDGRELVFENNCSGSYKLFRVRVPEFTAVSPQPLAASEPVLEDTVLHFSFNKKPDKVVEDLSPLGNDGRVHGKVFWKDGAVSFPGDDSYIAVPRPKGFDFGTGPFSVRATVKLPEYGDKCYICVGADPRQRLGWQLMVDKIDYVRFNSRTPEGTYSGAVSDVRIPKGCVVELVGMRDEAGQVSLYVDGALQQRTGEGALFSYQQPNEIRIGRQITGAGGFFGSIYSVTVCRRLLRPEETHAALLQRFWSRK